ncbi:hypothetical protein D9615_007074 [Tricholomella constricta]|uniref:DUF8191 domain-containing protein n=1 Tax=Tricholomella constricta TaxID=117010 RepID=A0A8H5M2R4_9AGAR|nr:hypothetical protein D9615_007074 [Tricholomella constricta]
MADHIELRARLERRDQTISNLRKRVVELEQEAERTAAEVADDFPEDEGEEEEEDDDDETLPEPMYDDMDEVYRCTECAWEIVEGICEGCQTEYQWDEQGDDGVLPADSLYTDSTYDPDRQQAPRGSTPLRDIGPFRPLPGHTREHYGALIRRGATRLMIETFNLEYTHARGIFAWADSTFYSELAGPKMQKGDFWKIQLGRRFDLDEDDFDGAIFVEGILEEAIMFPGVGQPLKWETVEESPGIWVTQTVRGQECQQPRDAAEMGDEVMDTEEVDEAPDNWELYDMRLEAPFVDDGPVLTSPGYDTTEDSESDDGMAVGEDVAEAQDFDMDADMSGEIQASVPDAVYDPGWAWEEEAAGAPVEALEVEEGAAPPALPLSGGDQDNKEDNIVGEERDETTTLESESNSDSVDSDFDDDEELSGDESLLDHAAIIS